MQRNQRESTRARAPGAAPRVAPSTAVALAAALLLGACEQTPDESDPAAFVEGFAGLAAADEPRAALVGRDVLANGGNAADAAVAMYFTMAVTLPSRAALGGGGTCVIFDNGDQTGSALVFLPEETAAGGLVPTGVRAMAALHARQGLMKWGELLRPGENLARFGHSASRALARDVELASGLLAGDPALAQIFRSESGSFIGEGDRVVQPELSGVLSGIRSQGAAYVHAGPFAGRYAELSTEAGLPVTLADMREAVPTFDQAIEVPLGLTGRDVAYFPPPPSAGGVTAGQLWTLLTEVESYDSLGTAEGAHLFAEAGMRAFADRGTWMAQGSAAEGAALVDEDRLEGLMAGYDDERHTPAASLGSQPLATEEPPAGASLIAGDRFGNAAACSLTMNGLFGLGRTAPGTGIVLARPPSAAANGFLSPVAAVVGNTTNGDLIFAGAASGGSAAVSALVSVMLDAVEEDERLETTIRTARVHHGGRPDEMFFETGMNSRLVGDLRARGHVMQEVATLGRVNALYCPEGVRDQPELCEIVSDPRGKGLAKVVQ